MLLSHVCIDPGRPSEKLSLDVHRYQRGGNSVTNVHSDCEQVTLDERTYPVKEGSVVFIPRGTRHSIKNTGEGELVLAFISTYLENQGSIAEVGCRR